MVKFPLAVGLFILASFPSAPICWAFRSVNVGMAAPPVAVRDLDAKAITISFGKRVVVLGFSRPNQPFSLEALKDLEQIGKEFSSKGVEIVAIFEATGQPHPVQESIKTLGLSYPIYLDPDRQVEEPQQ